MFNPVEVPLDGKESFTNFSRWRLRSGNGGGHFWDYLHTEEEVQSRPQTILDRYWLGMPANLPALPPANDALEAARNGYTFFKKLQADDGHWPGVYDGPMFLTPGLVIGSYVTGMKFTHEERLEMIRYLFNRADPEDGGWGLHIEGQSTAFGTVLNYVVLRLLGVDKEHPILVKARALIYKLGGACAVPSWGKFWLSVLNVYDWEGNNSIPPELWLLPESIPFHPSRWWIHTRNVYIPMSYLYAVRFQTPENDLILSLRQEIYKEDFYQIDWPRQRNNVCPLDVYVEHHPILNVLNGILSVYEQCSFPPARRAALKRVYELVVMEDENTAYQTLGPVSKMINQMVRFYVDGPESEAYAQHRLKRQDFMWLGPQGMMMSGTNGSQLWDIAFTTQALVESGLADEEENKQSVIAALEWLDQCQMQENPKHYEKAYRHRTKGAWPFSTKEQSYTVSDCTGEGLKSTIFLQTRLSYTPKLVSKERMCDSVDTLLSMQNPDGSYASYELIRGPEWLEYLNTAEVFGHIMIEYSYPECTTSSITALAIFRKLYPDYRGADIDRTINAAIKYVHSCQLPEGLWFGSWGICFTYATMFALESLSLVGETYENSESVRRACDYLVKMQREDGGWGESWKACETGKWTEHEKTQVVQTSWAGLALMSARYPHREPLEKAVKLVISRQRPDGSWAQEAIEGIFNKTCAIVYPNFKFCFTIWMLGKAHKYLTHLDGFKKPE